MYVVKSPYPKIPNRLNLINTLKHISMLGLSSSQQNGPPGQGPRPGMVPSVGRRKKVQDDSGIKGLAKGTKLMGSPQHKAGWGWPDTFTRPIYERAGTWLGSQFQGSSHTRIRGHP